MTTFTPADRFAHRAGIVARPAPHVSNLAALAATLSAARTERDNALAIKEAADIAFAAAEAAFEAAQAAWSAESTLTGGV